MRTIRKGAFIPPMLLLRTEKLPEGAIWRYELKHDGYRTVAYKSSGKLHLRSRNDKDFTERYREIARALSRLPNDTVIDGEVVALDESGRPSFQLLQNGSPGNLEIVYFVYDLMVLAGRDRMSEPFDVRRAVLEAKVLPQLSEPIRFSPTLNVNLPDLIGSVRASGLEGLVAKRGDSTYEPGLRSGAWQKMRVHQGQEFVIGGYTLGGTNFDALIIGYYEGTGLLYAARTRNGFTPSSRAALLKKLRPLARDTCPFDNLPETKKHRWGQGLTADKMKQCRWVEPLLVAQVQFLEWTDENHLRHARFAGLREDKDPREVRRESGG